MAKTITHRQAVQPAAPAAVAPAQKEVSKMDQAKVLFDEVTDLDYPLEGKTARREFMDRAVVEIGLTEKGANTYFQNLKSKASGGELYPHSQKSVKAEQPAAQPVPMARKQPAPEAEPEGESVQAQLDRISTQLTTLNRQLNKLTRQSAA